MLNEIKNEILSEKEEKIKQIIRRQYELVEKKRKEAERLAKELNEEVQKLEKMDKLIAPPREDLSIKTLIERADEFLNEFDPPATSILYVGKYTANYTVTV